MADIAKVTFCALFVFCLIDIGYGLNCLRCNSTHVMSTCKEGKRTDQPTVVKCYGRAASCYATAIVDEYGEARFERGCSRDGNCKVNDEDLEFCYTCRHNNCNFVLMDLDPEVENYLLEKKADPEQEMDQQEGGDEEDKGYEAEEGYEGEEGYQGEEGYGGYGRKKNVEIKESEEVYSGNDDQEDNNVNEGDEEEENKEDWLEED